MCVQEMTLVPRFHSIPMGEENCLFLNVHTPEVGAHCPILRIYRASYSNSDRLTDLDFTDPPPLESISTFQ
jgi:hypothetical protein